MSVSIQQAAANAFATWLASKLGSDVVVEPRWPSPNKKKSPKAITLVMAGPRQDTPIDLRRLSNTNQGTNQTQTVWQIAACTQPFQLDVWTESDVDLDDIIARLDVALNTGESSLAGVFNAMPVGYGNLIAVGDGWDAYGTIADFSFGEPDTDPSGDAVERDLYRATYRGEAYFMLTVTTVTARQIAINFLTRLSESDPAAAAEETYTTSP